MDEVADSNSVAPTIFSPSGFLSRRAFLCLFWKPPNSHLRWFGSFRKLRPGHVGRFMPFLELFDSVAQACLEWHHL